MLQDHFLLLYRKIAKESDENIHRYFSGIPYPFFNCVFGEANIDEQLKYFKVPFVWYLEESSSLKKDLLARGFQDMGVYRAVERGLDKAIPKPKVPVGYTLGEATMEEYREVVCPVFGIQGISQEKYLQFLWSTPNMHHWIARKDGKAVSAITTFRDGEMVSFWNGATLPEYRRQGISTALRCFALRHAASKGSRIGVSYLMSEGMAFGICSRLGYHTKWQFQVLLSP